MVQHIDIPKPWQEKLNAIFSPAVWQALLMAVAEGKFDLGYHWSLKSDKAAEDYITKLSLIYSTLGVQLILTKYSEEKYDLLINAPHYNLEITFLDVAYLLFGLEKVLELNLLHENIYKPITLGELKEAIRVYLDKKVEDQDHNTRVRKVDQQATSIIKVIGSQFREYFDPHDRNDLAIVLSEEDVRFFLGPLSDVKVLHNMGELRAETLRAVLGSLYPNLVSNNTKS